MPNTPDYQLRRDFFRLAHWSKAGFVFLLFAMAGLLLIATSEESSIRRDLGIALVPVGIIAFLYEIFLRQEFLNEMRLELGESLSQHFDQFDRLRRAGVHDIVDTFQTSEIAQRFETAERIRIAQTWIPDIITLLKPTIRALQHGATAKILLLDPDSALAAYRSKSLDYADGTMASHNIKANLAEISRAVTRAGVGDRIEVRLYDAIPTCCLHAYDNEAVIGFFWQGVPAISGPQMILSRGDSHLMATVNDHFDNTWKLSKVYPLVSNSQPAVVANPQPAIAAGNPQPLIPSGNSQPPESK